MLALLHWWTQPSKKQEVKEDVVEEISDKTKKTSESEVGETTEAKNANSESQENEVEMSQ